MIRRVVAAFAVTQTVGYGVLFYTFGVFITPIASDLGTSRTAVTGAMTVSVLATAVAAYPVGRWLDRRGGRALMTVGSIAATIAVALWSQVNSVFELYLVFVLIGLCKAAVLYEAAFTVIVKHASARYILPVTVVAGFAGTIFMPLAGVLGESLGWRSAVLVLAIAHGALCIGPHAFLVPSGKGKEHDGPQVPAKDALRDAGFWFLAVAFTANAASVTSVAVHLVAYLQEQRHSITVAAGVAGLIGIMSVTGRIVITRLARRYPMTTVVTWTYLLQAAGIAWLPVAGRSLPGAVICVLIFGLGFGIANIAKPALIADRYGAAEYGAISGTIALMTTIANAVAPLAVVAISLRILPYFSAVLTLAAAASLALLNIRPRVEPQSAGSTS
jgi:predicted MFS family arabinose efflux permease